MTDEQIAVEITTPPVPDNDVERSLLEWLMSLPIPAEDGKRHEKAA